MAKNNNTILWIIAIIAIIFIIRGVSPITNIFSIISPQEENLITLTQTENTVRILIQTKGISGIDFDLIHPNLEIETIEGGDFFDFTMDKKYEGKTGLAGAVFGTSDKVGKGTLFTISFKEEGDVSIENIEAFDNDFNQIDFRTFKTERQIRCPDVNEDGIINIMDLATMGLAYGSTPESPNWNPNCDLNYDSVVNTLDTGILGHYMGKTVNEISECL